MGTTYDVAVIGAGPAGATAAYQLAQRGFEVGLLEKHPLPRYKACGGVVPTHVDKILDFSIRPTVEGEFSRILVTPKFGRPFVTESPRPFAYLVMRDVFDSFLVETARRAGADVRADSGLVALQPDECGYRIRTSQGECRARYVIGADGANSTVRKRVGAPRFQRMSVAVDREISASPNATKVWQHTIALDFGRLPSGYAWVFPKAKNFSVGAGGPQDVARELAPYCNEMVAHYKHQMGNDRPYISLAHYLPIRVRNEPIVFGRTLLAGDAAGLIEPLTGEGIYYAMRSGQIAADSIAESLRRGDQYLAGYQRRIDEEIQPELQVAKTLLWLLDLAPGFWVPRLLKPSHGFWRHFYRVFTGEAEYRDLPGRLGLLGRLFFALFQQR